MGVDGASILDFALDPKKVRNGPVPGKATSILRRIGETCILATTQEGTRLYVQDPQRGFNDLVHRFDPLVHWS